MILYLILMLTIFQYLAPSTACSVQRLFVDCEQPAYVRNALSLHHSAPGFADTLLAALTSIDWIARLSPNNCY
jgi:hypothetical protein